MIINVGTKTGLGGIKGENVDKVTFEVTLSRAQIEALSERKEAVQNRIYIATDGGIYIGGIDGMARECADLSIWEESANE